jgi:hypothetical protein
MGVEIVAVNFVYAFLGIMIGIGTMYLGYKILNRLTFFSTSEQLYSANIAVGLMVLGMFVGIGICAGLIIGLALN